MHYTIKLLDAEGYTLRTVRIGARANARKAKKIAERLAREAKAHSSRVEPTIRYNWGK